MTATALEEKMKVYSKSLAGFAMLMGIAISLFIIWKFEISVIFFGFEWKDFWSRFWQDVNVSGSVYYISFLILILMQLRMSGIILLGRNRREAFRDEAARLLTMNIIVTVLGLVYYLVHPVFWGDGFEPMINGVSFYITVFGVLVKALFWMAANKYLNWEAAKANSLEQGKAKGRELTILWSVRVGDYSAERGAEKLGISVEEIQQRLAGSGEEK